MRRPVIVEVMRRLRLTPIPGATPEAVGRICERLERVAPGTVTPSRVMEVLRDVARAEALSDVMTRDEALDAHLMGLATTAPDRSRGSQRPSGPEWTAFVRKYRSYQQRTGTKRPTQEDIADEMGIGERTLREKLHGLGIRDFRHVHAFVDSDPEVPAGSRRLR